MGGRDLVKAGLERDKAALLVVMGAMPNGTKEVLAVKPGSRESTDSSPEVFRGLTGSRPRSPKLLMADGSSRRSGARRGRCGEGRAAVLESQEGTSWIAAAARAVRGHGLSTTGSGCRGQASLPTPSRAPSWSVRLARSSRHLRELKQSSGDLALRTRSITAIAPLNDRAYSSASVVRLASVRCKEVTRLIYLSRAAVPEEGGEAYGLEPLKTLSGTHVVKELPRRKPAYLIADVAAIRRR